MFIDLTAVQNDDRVGSTILQGLGGQLRHGNETEAAAELIGERRLLLVLDNCEQVIGGAADATQRLLLGCPELHLLATSREPLGVPGEALTASSRCPSRLPARPLGPTRVSRCSSTGHGRPSMDSP